MCKEQALIDICFSLVLASTEDPVFCQRSIEEKATWVSDVLRDCGFNTIPVGSSWGYLTKDLV